MRGDTAAVAAHYWAATDRTTSLPERRYLLRLAIRAQPGAAATCHD
jgi:hypothetical protein